MLLKIIALAVAGLVSGGAFAQSTVTISGLVDLGYYSQSIQTAGVADTKTYAAANGSSTSALFITATEDLGNGLSAGFFGETDWAPAGNASVLLNSYNYLHLTSTKFGSLKGGNLNTAALYATIGAQPFGTGIGSGISGSFGRLSRAGSNGAFGTAVNTATAGIIAEGEFTTAGTAFAGARSVRVNNSIQYTTPMMSGFSASLHLSKKNDDGAVAAAGGTAGLTALGLQYSNGPINVYYVNEVVQAGSMLAAAAPTGNVAGLGANEKVTHNILSGNYTFGPATIYGGWTSSKSSGVAVQTADARSWNIALKYAITGALSIGANILKVDDKLTGSDKDRNLNSLGLDYAMSKRTNGYVRYENGDNDRSSATGGGVGGFSRWQAGMKHTF